MNIAAAFCYAVVGLIIISCAVTDMHPFAVLAGAVAGVFSFAGASLLNR